MTLPPGSVMVRYVCVEQLKFYPGEGLTAHHSPFGVDNAAQLGHSEGVMKPVTLFAAKSNPWRDSMEAIGQTTPGSRH